MAGNDGLSDLFTSINMFKESMTELSGAVALNRGAQRLKEIKEGFDKETGEHLTEAQQFEQMQQLGQGLATSMFMLGKPATTVQTLLGSMGLSANTPEELITQGTKTGGTLGDYMGERGKKALEAANAPKLRELQEKLKFEAEQRALDRATKAEATEVKAAKLKDLPGPQLTKLEELDGNLDGVVGIRKSLMGTSAATSLFNKIKGYSTLASINDPALVEPMTRILAGVLEYQHKISGAAVNDREKGDIERAYVTEKDAPSVAMKKVETLEKIAKEQYERKLSFFKSGKFDISGYEARYQEKYGKSAKTGGNTLRRGYNSSGVLEEQLVDPNGKVLKTRPLAK